MRLPSVSGPAVGAGTRTRPPSKDYAVLTKERKTAAGSAMHACFLRRAVAATLLVLAQVACWKDVSTTGVVMRLLVRVVHADGRPAKAVSLWYVDHELTSRQRRTIFPTGPVCTTDATGSCVTTIAYLYSTPAWRWGILRRSKYDGRFEMRTLLRGKEWSLGFLQVVAKKGGMIEGAMTARVD